MHTEAGSVFVDEGLFAVGDHRFQVEQSYFAICKSNSKARVSMSNADKLYLNAQWGNVVNRTDNRLHKSGVMRHKNSRVGRKSWIASQSADNIKYIENTPHNVINLQARPATGAICVTGLRLDNVLLVFTPWSSYLCKRNAYALSENREMILCAVDTALRACDSHVMMVKPEIEMQ